MTTTYSVKLGVLRRFVRIVSAAFVAGGVPGAVAAVQSPEIHQLGTQLLGAAGVAVAAGALAALDKARTQPTRVVAGDAATELGVVTTDRRLQIRARIVDFTAWVGLWPALGD